MKIVLFVVLFAVCAAGQSGIPGYEPERLASYLKKIQTEEEGCEQGSKKCEAFYADESITKELQMSLGVRGCEKVVAARVRVDGEHEAGFVRMQCGWDLDLVFTQRGPKGWQFLQTIVIPNKYRKRRIDLQSVTGDASQQVLIHKAQYESGTGVKQQNFVVYKLIDGKLVSVLDVVESAYIMSPWVEHGVSQESRFVYQRPSQTKGLDTDASFEETQVVEFSGKKVELKRNHTWSSKLHEFVASQWFSARMLAPPKPLR